MQNPTPIFPTNVDNTILSQFDSCPQKCFNEHFLHISKAGISPDLHAGGAFAAALEVARHAIYCEGRSVMDALVLAYPVFTREWGLYEPPEKNPKSYTAMFSALIDYFREYPPEDDPLPPFIMANGKPALEFTFAIPLPINHPTSGEPLLYSGRFDMLSECMPNQLCVVDEKTTKNFSYYWSDMWAMRGQFRGYVWAAQQHGLPCEHFAVRGIAIQKTQIKHLHHGPVPTTRAQVDDWYTNMLRKVQRLVDMWNRMDPADPHPAWDRSYAEACTQYGICPYTEMCLRPGMEATLYPQYEYRKWDPLEKNPTAGSQNRLSDLEGMSIEELI